VHPGQYLNEGTQITTLQGVDSAVYVDFTVAQQVAAALHKGAVVDVAVADGAAPKSATVIATDARIDPTTRNSAVRALVQNAPDAFTPGASVRVGVPVGPERLATAVPVSALRKGPDGDHLFVLEQDQQGKVRARLRRVIAGAMLDDDVIIEKGVTAGERIAGYGSFKLHEAALVAVVPGGGGPSGGR